MNDLPPIIAAPPGPPRTPGIWRVLGSMLLIILLLAAIEGVVMFGYVMAKRTPGGMPDWNQGSSGTPVILATLVSTPLMFLILRRRAAKRQPGAAWAYLGFKTVPIRTVIFWTGMMLLLCAGMDCLSLAIGHPVVDNGMIALYQSAGSKIALLAVVILVAPFIEETMMRGYFFEGLKRTKLGFRGAILGSALVFASLHVQYDLYGMANIFAGALLFGIARNRTGSILTTMAMHAAMNFGATVELLVVLYRAHKL